VRQVTHWRNTQNELQRLKSSIDFERVRRDGRSHAHPLVVLVARQRDAASSGPARFGFAAGKRLGTAVARNRAKRLLREAARAEAAAVAPGWDLIFIARQPLPRATLGEVKLAVAGLLQRAGVLERDD
jgi:ribonuclease P protein component